MISQQPPHPTSGETPPSGSGPEVDFGFQRVPEAEKAARVGAVFASVAPHYDVMNDVMSLGLHRWWKHYTLQLAQLRPGQRVLDLAGGTGDLAQAMLPQVGPSGAVILADINLAMLRQGRDRHLNQGISGLHYIQADAEALPFATDHFDVVTLAFGLRNVTHKDQALAEIYRVLKPGGQLLVLEFSKPVLPGLNTVYDLYSFHVLPQLGAWIANDRASYEYLVQSIRRHPPQAELQALFEQAGFTRCTYFNLSGGIVAVHRGYKV